MSAKKNIGNIPRAHQELTAVSSSIVGSTGVQPIGSNRVCAVFVTYNPGIDFLENVRRVHAQVGHTIIVDNGSSSRTQLQLNELETWSQCTIIRNNVNLGIATALNQGVMKGVESNFEWIATFDQDSRISENFIVRMLLAFQQSETPERIALVSPTYVDRESGKTVRLRREKNGGILTTMTSGTMVRSHLFNHIGLFDESLFIDAVDTEFCLRARRIGMQIIQSDAVLHHSLGKTTYHRIMGAQFGATNHSIGRRYYITRNRWILLFRYGTDRIWVWNELRAMVHETIKIVLVERHKWKKFYAMGLATAHAIQGKVGKQVEL